MSVLHDHPLLAPNDIQEAWPGNEINLQIDPVRIAWQLLSIDELSKLWSVFRASYRISAAFT
jgi:Pvc16 N-terminal domain